MTEIAIPMVAYCGPHAVRVILHHDNTDPYAVTLVFRDHLDGKGRPKRWTFALSLLAVGLYREVAPAAGVVQAWPEAGAVAISLRGPEEWVTYYLDGCTVAQFVGCARRAAARSGAVVDADLDRFLAGA